MSPLRLCGEMSLRSICGRLSFFDFNDYLLHVASCRWWKIVALRNNLGDFDSKDFEVGKFGTGKVDLGDFDLLLILLNESVLLTTTKKDDFELYFPMKYWSTHTIQFWLTKFSFLRQSLKTQSWGKKLTFSVTETIPIIKNGFIVKCCSRPNTRLKKSFLICAIY